jgi:hypothetical protein
MSNKSNNIFIDDLKYGLKYEALAMNKIIDKYKYKIVKISDGYQPKYDFKLANMDNKMIRYEVKTTQMAYSTIFIEFKNKDGKPTGISLSTAHYYIFVDVSKNDEQYYVIETSLLKQIIELHTIRMSLNKYKNSVGYIIDKNIIIGSSVQL